MASLPSQLSPTRFQKYLFRLPLFTRIILLLLLLFWILELQSAWDVASWGSLVPQSVSLTSSISPTFHLYRQEANYLELSVPFEHLSSRPYRLHTFPAKCIRRRSSAGTFRGRVRDPTDRSLLCWA